MIKLKVKTIIKTSLITLLIATAYLIIIVFPSLHVDYSDEFINSGWVSSDSPVFYHYFSEDNGNITIEIHDKTGDLASITGKGLLKGNTLTFAGTNDSTNIYKFEDGIIRVFNINRNGITKEFTPLERIENGY